LFLKIIIFLNFTVVFSQTDNYKTTTSINQKINRYTLLLKNERIENSKDLNNATHFSLSLFGKNKINTNQELDYAHLCAEKNYSFGNYDKSIQIIKNTFIQKNSYSLERFQNLIAQNYVNKRELDSALNYYNLAVKNCLKNKKKELLAEVYDNMGNYFREIDDTSKMFDYFFKSLKIKEDINSKDLCFSYLNIGSQFRISGDIDKALIYNDRAYKSIEKSTNKTAHLYVYFYRADLFRVKKDFEKTIYFSRKAIKIADELNDNNSKGYNQILLGIAYEKSNRLKEAINVHKEAFELFTKINRPIGAMQASNSLGNDYYKADSISKNKEMLKKSLFYLLKANEISKIYGITDDKKNNAKLLKQTYFAIGNYNKAYEMLALEKKFNDSLLIDKNNGLKKELEFQYAKKNTLDSIKNETQKQLNELKVEKEKSKNRYLYYLISILLAIAVVMYSRFKYIEKKKELLIETQKTLVQKNQKELISTELDYLKAQINPHFLFNALNTIYFKINKTNNNAREALLGFSEILRYQLYECNFPEVSIEKEIKYLQDYINLQLMRKNDNYKCNLNISPNINNIEIAPLILITFVENAFKYIRIDKQKINEINIFLNSKGDTFIFEIENDKNNFDNQILETTGIGLKNVKRRLDLIYNKNYSLEIQDKKEKFKVLLTIKLTENDAKKN